jgi:hypothetical protein
METENKLALFYVVMLSFACWYRLRAEILRFGLGAFCCSKNILTHSEKGIIKFLYTVTRKFVNCALFKQQRNLFPKYLHVIIQAGDGGCVLLPVLHLTEN